MNMRSSSEHTRVEAVAQRKVLTPDDLAMLALLAGEAVSIGRFTPGPEISAAAVADFKPGDQVWLSLDCPIANPFTGEKGVFAEAIVLSVCPDTTGSPSRSSRPEADSAMGQGSVAGQT